MNNLWFYIAATFFGISFDLIFVTFLLIFLKFVLLTSPEESHVTSVTVFGGMETARGTQIRLA